MRWRHYPKPKVATVERERVQIIAQEEQYAQRFSHMHNIVIYTHTHMYTTTTTQRRLS